MFLYEERRGELFLWFTDTLSGPYTPKTKMKPATFWRAKKTHLPRNSQKPQETTAFGYTLPKQRDKLEIGSTHRVKIIGTWNTRSSLGLVFCGRVWACCAPILSCINMYTTTYYNWLSLVYHGISAYLLWYKQVYIYVYIYIQFPWVMLLNKICIHYKIIPGSNSLIAYWNAYALYPSYLPLSYSEGNKTLWSDLLKLIIHHSWLMTIEMHQKQQMTFRRIHGKDALLIWGEGYGYGVWWGFSGRTSTALSRPSNMMELSNALLNHLYV